MKKAASANPLGNNGQVCSFCAAFSSLSSGFLAHGGVTQRHFGSRFPKNRHPTLTFLALIDLVSNISKQLLRTTSRHSWRLVGENCVGLRIEKDTSYPPRTPLPELNACNNLWPPNGQIYWCKINGHRHDVPGLSICPVLCGHKILGTNLCGNWNLVQTFIGPEDEQIQFFVVEGQSLRLWYLIGYQRLIHDVLNPKG